MAKKIRSSLQGKIKYRLMRRDRFNASEPWIYAVTQIKEIPLGLVEQVGLASWVVVDDAHSGRIFPNRATAVEWLVDRRRHQMEKLKDTVTDEEFDPAELPVQVCGSAAGYYIGQLEPCGAPFSRLSGYYKTFGDAEKALKAGWPDRGADENKTLVRGLVAAGKIGKVPVDPTIEKLKAGAAQAIEEFDEDELERFSEERRKCPHGNDPVDCDACYHQADLAYDSAREDERR